jgi:hypothetical protein
VLEGIDYFQRSSEDEVRPKELGEFQPLEPHSLIPIAERTNFNGEIRVKCGVELDEADIEAAREHLRKTSDGYRLEDLQRELSTTDCYVYKDSRFVTRKSTWSGLQGSGFMKTGSKRRLISYQKDSDRWQILATFIRSRLPSIWFFPNLLFDFPDKIYIEAYEGEDVSNRFYRALFQDVLDGLNRSLTVDKHIVERYRSGAASDQDNLRQVLLDASRHVTKTVVASWNQIFRDKPISHKRVMIDIGADESSDTEEAERLWVQFRIEDTDGLFSIAERSLGLRWFFVYLMLTTYRGRRKPTDENMLYLFDGPASNLHPTAQKTLLASLGELSHKAVIIYTTHSHYLIEPAWLGSTAVVANEGLGEQAVSSDFTSQRTDIRVTSYRKFAASHPEQSHYFQPILDVLDYAPSAIEMIPEAAMVEGKSDFYLLRYYEEVILELSVKDQLGWMPGGGAGTLDDLIQLYIGWARPFVALLDSDKAGARERERYIQKFGQIVEPHLVLLAEASGRDDARGIESLLTDEDKIAFQRVVDPSATSFQKKTLLLGMQEALVAKVAVQLSAVTTNALTAVIEELKRRLAQVS